MNTPQPPLPTARRVAAHPGDARASGARHLDDDTLPLLRRWGRRQVHLGGAGAGPLRESGHSPSFTVEPMRKEPGLHLDTGRLLGVARPASKPEPWAAA